MQARASVHRRKSDPLVAEARKGDPLAWEAACRLAARMIEQGDPLHLIGRFAVDVLLGKTIQA